MRVLLCCLAFVLVSYRVDGSGDYPGEGEEPDYNVQRAFRNFTLGSVIPSIPSNLLTVRFGNREALLGNVLCPFETVFFPLVSYDANPRSLYTLLFFNPDIGYSYNGTYGVSYLIALTVNIPGENVNDGDIVTDYKISLPLPGSVLSRNVFLVFKQSRRINNTLELRRTSNFGIFEFNVDNFVKQNRLGDPIAGNFYLTGLTLCETDGQGGTLDDCRGVDCCPPPGCAIA